MDDDDNYNSYDDYSDARKIQEEYLAEAEKLDHLDRESSKLIDRLVFLYVKASLFRLFKKLPEVFQPHLPYNVLKSSYSLKNLKDLHPKIVKILEQLIRSHLYESKVSTTIKDDSSFIYKTYLWVSSLGEPWTPWSINSYIKRNSFLDSDHQENKKRGSAIYRKIYRETAIAYKKNIEDFLNVFKSKN